MSLAAKKLANPEVDAKIITLKGGRANWFVRPLTVKPNSRITWRCGIHTITLMFPKEHNPIAGGKTEIHGKNGKATAVVGSNEGTYYYCILVTDEQGAVHLVEGNSPPTMVIQ